MTKQEFIAWAKSRGWESDRWGNLQKSMKKKGELHDTICDYRYKLCPRVVRLEVKIKIGDTNEWIRIRSGYYSKLSLNEGGKIVGLTYKGS